MRLKNKPWANELVEEHPESALDRPDPAEKIDWAARFGNDKPIGNRSRLRQGAVYYYFG